MNFETCTVTSLFALVIGEFFGGKWAGIRLREREPEALGIYLSEWLFFLFDILPFKMEI